MKVLVVNQFFAPDTSATSLLLTELCEALVAQGDSVTVIASRGSHTNDVSLPNIEERNGVRVLRPWSTDLGKSKLLYRISDYATFWAAATAAALRQVKPDVLLTLTTPPLLSIGVSAAAWRHQVPLVCWVQDVYPELGARLGVIREGGQVYRSLDSMARFGYNQAQRVVAISGDMAEHLVGRGVPKEKISVVRNWASSERFLPRPAAATDFRRMHGLSESFLAMYSGNLGAGHDVSTMIDAARSLRERAPGFTLALIGGGQRLKEAQMLAADVPNVRFFPHQSLEEVADTLSAADVHLVTLRADMGGLMVPSKLYAIMALSRPVCYVGPRSSEVDHEVLAHEMGLSVRNGDGQTLASGFERLLQDSTIGRKMGSNARAAFERLYDLPDAIQKWRRILLQAVASPPSSNLSNRPRTQHPSPWSLPDA